MISSHIHSSYSNTNNRQQSSLAISNLADVPKHLTTTLAKPIASFHSPTTKHIHSPNDVVDRLLQSINLHDKTTKVLLNKFLIISYSFSFIKLMEHKLHRFSSRCTYQESQQHKAKLISNLLSSKSIQKLPIHHHHCNLYH